MVITKNSQSRETKSVNELLFKLFLSTLQYPVLISVFMSV